MNEPRNVADEYHLFAGKFITAYANLEWGLRWLAKILSGLDDDQYQALVGYPRSGDLRALVKKLADLKDLDAKKRRDVESAFNQLTIISKVRDWIVHYGALSSNEGKTFAVRKNESASSHTEFDLEKLKPALDDLYQISKVLTYNLADIPLTGSFDGTWRYKPLPPLH